MMGFLKFCVGMSTVMKMVGGGRTSNGRRNSSLATMDKCEDVSER